ncbi:MAG: nucleotide exchange factor GrpE [Candidatus Thalassarchaeaceae archaeon]|nr:nucleotide exchange factor GrpE [Candidatus Thalassarchaeaceae archaeon]
MTEEPPEELSEEDPEVETDLETKLEELEKELQYARAETVNARQRAAKDRSEAIRYGGAPLARRLIPAVDVLSKALDAAEEGDGNASVIEGVRLTLEGIKASLEAEGIVQIEALGESFDPTCMEAIATVPSSEDANPGTVIEVIEQGFKMHERVLRASRVIVAEGDS